MAALLLRRASYPLIHLATRSATYSLIPRAVVHTGSSSPPSSGSAVSHPAFVKSMFEKSTPFPHLMAPCVSNRPFASLIPPPSSGSVMSPALVTSAVSYFFDRIENLFARHSNGIALPNGFQFDLSYCVGYKRGCLKKPYGNEMLFVEINCDDPSIPIEVNICAKNLLMITSMIGNPGQDELDIHEVIVRHEKGDMGDCEYKDYLQTKGISSKTINFFYQLLGYKQMET